MHNTDIVLANQYYDQRYKKEKNSHKDIHISTQGTQSKFLKKFF